jgi:hypothetical protein
MFEPNKKAFEFGWTQFIIYNLRQLPQCRDIQKNLTTSHSTHLLLILIKRKPRNRRELPKNGVIIHDGIASSSGAVYK